MDFPNTPFGLNAFGRLAFGVTSELYTTSTWLAAYKGEDDTQNIGIDGDICNLMPKGYPSATSNHGTPVYAKTADRGYQAYDANTPVWTGGRYTRNNARWSEDLTNAVYALAGLGLGSVPITTLIAAGGPNGEDATRIQLDLNGGTTTADQSRIVQAVGTVENSPTSMSIWIKSNDTNDYAVRYDFNGQGPSDDSPTILAGQEWVKIERTFDSASGTVNNATLKLRGAQGTSDIADILVTGWQQNNLSSVGEYVKTTDAARTVTYSTDTNGVALSPHPFLQANTATTNLLFPSEPPVNSSFTVPATEHILWIEGTGSITSSYGTATEAAPLIFTGTAASVAFTVVGTVAIAQIQLGNVKGTYVSTTTAPESITETDYTYPADNIDPSNATVSFQMEWAGDNVDVLDIGGELTLSALSPNLILSDETNSVSVAITEGTRGITLTLTVGTMTLNVDGVAASGAYIPPAAGVITCKEDMWALSSRPYA